MVQPKIGEPIIYVDAYGVEHTALVTNSFGDPERPEDEMSVNVAYIDPNEGSTDQYGRQILRETSVVPMYFQSAHGRYWKWPGAVKE